MKVIQICIKQQLSILPQLLELLTTRLKFFNCQWHFDVWSV